MKNKVLSINKTLLVVVFFMILLIGFLTNSSTNAYAINNGTELFEEKIYCNTTIDEDFDESCVLVVIDKYHSEVNKVYDKNFFGDVSIREVEDLTSFNSNIDNLDYLNLQEFRQILKLELEEPSKQNVLDTIHSIENIDGVLSASPSHYLRDCTLPGCVTGENYTNLWGLHGDYGINAEEAWEITTGNSGVRVGIIDTGVDNHNDLSGNLVTGWNVLADNATQTDNVGHGTHIAGTIGANGENINGIVGVSPNVSLVPIQAAIGLPVPILNMVIPIFNEETCVAGIEWAIENNIDIINFSIGGYSETLALKTAISNYTGLFVCAAGNGIKNDLGEYEGVNTDVTPHYPSCYNHGEEFSDRVISVGAMSENGVRTYFSNYGATSVDIFAPGENILSTVPNSISNSGYAYFNGTSMATPHVVGTAALLYSQFLRNSHNLTRSEIAVLIKSIIIKNATIDVEFSGKCVAGGRLNAYKALSNNSYKQVMTGFGYYSTLRHWHGKVDLLINNISSFYTNRLVVTKVTDLVFSVGTKSAYNTWHEINGTVTFELKNSAGEIIQINNNNTFTSTIRVGLISNTSYTNRGFTINSANLPNDTYTLLLNCYTSRDGQGQTSSASFTFIINKSSCIAAGSLITLSDGSQVAVENLVGNEELLVWNMQTGSFDVAPIFFIDNDPFSTYEVIELTFSDNSKVQIIDEHAFFNATIGKYVFLTNNADQYIGHYFNKYNNIGGQNDWNTVQLVNVEIFTTQTSAWSPVTYGHLCYYVNGMLSLPGGIEILTNIFDVDTELMKYDLISFNQDINEYGLFSYEEFCLIWDVPEVFFEAFNGKYLKVALGKELISIEDVTLLIERYQNLF